MTKKQAFLNELKLIKQGYYDDWALTFIANINNISEEDVKDPRYEEVFAPIIDFLLSRIAEIDDNKS